MGERPYTVEWRPLLRFPPYEVSSDGRIRSPRRAGTTGAERRQKTNKGGYRWLTLCQKGTRHDVFVHRLVLEAFVGPVPDGMVTAHLDGNPANNNLSNLAWVTQKENMAHREAHGTAPRGERNHSAKLTLEQVVEIRTLFGAVSLKKIARQYGVSYGAIQGIKRGTTWAGP